MMRRRLKIMMVTVLKSIATTIMIAMDMKCTNYLKSTKGKFKEMKEENAEC